MIYKKLILGTFIVAGLSMASCSSEAEGTKEQETTIDSTSGAGGSDTAAQTMTISPQQMPAGATTAPSGPTAEGMNPAHGEPKHRCDIPVGAPLNSPPGDAKGSAPQVQMAPQSGGAAGSPQIQMQQAPPTAQPAAAGKPGGKVNPAHGQPGHDCKVAVGAPLP